MTAESLDVAPKRKARSGEGESQVNVSPIRILGNTGQAVTGREPRWRRQLQVASPVGSPRVPEEYLREEWIRRSQKVKDAHRA